MADTATTAKPGAPTPAVMPKTTAVPTPVIKPMAAPLTTALQAELKQVKADYEQTMRDLSTLGKLMSTQLTAYRTAVAGTKPPAGATAAIDQLQALVASIPQ